MQNGASPSKCARDLAEEAELQEEDKSSEKLIAQVLCAGAAEEKAGKPKRRTSSRLVIAKHTADLDDALSGNVSGEHLQSAKQNADLAMLRANAQEALSYRGSDVPPHGVTAQQDQRRASRALARVRQPAAPASGTAYEKARLASDRAQKGMLS